MKFTPKWYWPRSLVSRVGYLAYLPKAPEKESIIVQIPVSTGSAGAPIVNRKGLLLGMIYSSMKPDPTNFAVLRHMDSLNEQIKQFDEVHSASKMLEPAIELTNESLDCNIKNADGTVRSGTIVGLQENFIKNRFELDLGLLAIKKRGTKEVQVHGTTSDNQTWSMNINISRHIDDSAVEPSLKLPPRE